MRARGLRRIPWWIVGIGIAFILAGFIPLLPFGDTAVNDRAPRTIVPEEVAGMARAAGTTHSTDPSPLVIGLTPYAHPTPPPLASAIQPEYALCTNPIGCHYKVCQVGSLQGTSTLWTPVIVLDSPYDGSATGTSSVTVTGGYAFSFDQSNSIQSSTSSTVSNSISASGGQTEGYFQSDVWGLYTVYNVTLSVGFLGTYTPNPCTVLYLPMIYSTTTQYQVYTLAPSGSETTVQIPYQVSFLNTVTGATESSVIGLNSLNYISDNDQSLGNCGGGSFTLGVTDSTSVSTSIGVTVSIGIGPVSVDGSISFSSSTTSTAAYTYTFNSNSGTWLFDSLNGQSGGLVAFDFYACSSHVASGCFIPPSGGCSTSVRYSPGQTMQMSVTVPTSSSPVSVRAFVNNGGASVHPWSTSSTGWTYTIDFGAAPNIPGVYVVYAIVTFSNGGTSWTNACQVIIT